MNLKNQLTYLQNKKIDMFQNCTVPDGLNMEAVRGSIVMRCGLLTPLYSEPETQMSATEQFFFENQWNFKHLIEIVKAEYSPIENVSETTDETTGDSFKHSNTRGTTRGESVENKVSAENVSYYQPDNTSVTSNNENVSDNGTENRDISFKRRRHGNIGVTTNTQLINEELYLIRTFNVYKKIADLYADSLMLQIFI